MSQSGGYEAYMVRHRSTETSGELRTSKGCRFQALINADRRRTPGDVMAFAEIDCSTVTAVGVVSARAVARRTLRNTTGHHAFLFDKQTSSRTIRTVAQFPSLAVTRNELLSSFSRLTEMGRLPAENWCCNFDTPSNAD